jgi:hypothetical protein
MSFISEQGEYYFSNIWTTYNFNSALQQLLYYFVVLYFANDLTEENPF